MARTSGLKVVDTAPGEVTLYAYDDDGSTVTLGRVVRVMSRFLMIRFTTYDVYLHGELSRIGNYAGQADAVDALIRAQLSPRPRAFPLAGGRWQP